MLGFGRKTVTVPPFGGELRPAATVPQGTIERLGRKEFVIYLLLILALIMTMLNLGLGFLAQRKADATVFVADGSPFGCQVTELTQ